MGVGYGSRPAPEPARARRSGTGMQAHHRVPKGLAHFAPVDPRLPFDPEGLAGWIVAGGEGRGPLGRSALEAIARIVSEKIAAGAEWHAYLMGEAVLRLRGDRRHIDEHVPLSMTRRRLSAGARVQALDVMSATGEALAVVCSHAWNKNDDDFAREDLDRLGIAVNAVPKEATGRLASVARLVHDAVRARLAVLFREAVWAPLVCKAEAPGRIWTAEEFTASVASFDSMVALCFDIPGFDRERVRAERVKEAAGRRAMEAAEENAPPELRGPMAGEA